MQPPPNPYAPPIPGTMAGPQTPGDGTPQPWQIGEAIQAGWEALKREPVLLIGGYFLTMVVPAVPTFIPMILLAAQIVQPESAEYWAVYSVTTLISWLASAFFAGGQMRVALAMARGSRPEFGVFFSGGDVLLPIIGANVLIAISVVIGMLLLIVPGVFLGLAFSQAIFYCADARLGAIEAMRASWRATDGHKGQLFLLWLILGAITVLGICACYIGVVATTPLMMVALAFVFTRISGRMRG